jgi:beta-glucosidase
MPEFVYELTAANLKAASDKAGVDNYRLSNVVRKDEFDAMGDGLEAAHISARKAIRAAAPNVKLGLSIAIVDDRVVGDDPSLRDRKREEVYGRWLRLAKDDDFIGIQNYESVYYDSEHAIEPGPDVPRNGMGSAIDPTSLEGAVRYAYEQAGVPVYVTEHGLSTTDDTQRAAFIKPALVGLQNAIADGVEVLGYTHWSLLDNFEWIFGYGPKFGLFDVNFETFERTAKPSAGVLAEIVKNNAV